MQVWNVLKTQLGARPPEVGSDRENKFEEGL